MTITELLEYISKNVINDSIIYKGINNTCYDLIYYNKSLYYYDNLNYHELNELSCRDILELIDLNVKFQVI